jgi:hypothetical protein
VASVHDIRLSSDDPADSIKYVLDAARSEVDQAFAISERLDNKVRNQISLAAGFFAVAQAVAGWTVGAGLERAWLITVVIAALGSAVALIAAVRKCFEAWQLESEKALSHERLRTLGEDAYRHDPKVAAALVGLYVRLLETRRAGNEQRVARVKDAAQYSILAMSIAAIELVLTLAARGDLLG